MKILLVTDAWKPQVNGVVRTLTKTVEECEKAGHIVEVIAPSDGYFTLPLPTYNEIRIALFTKRDVERRLVMFGPDAVHIATEGPLGMAARALCLKWGMPFTTSYHTKFPEYVHARFPFIPTKLVYKFVRDFHNSGGQVMVTTPSMVEFLDKKNFNNLVPWARGVDLSLFRPDIRFNQGDEFGPDVYERLERPIFLNVGRIAVEKNIEAFLKADLPGSKIIVGEGPQLSELKRKYASERVKFVGAKFERELARYFADADVFVFPSKTDTFGLVIIEAMATGTPVAGYPVHGPIDIIPGSNAGVIDEDLQIACLACLELERTDAAAHAKNYAWEKVAEDFVSYLVPETEPQRRLRWRRARRAIKLASAPWRIFKKGVRRVGRFLKTGK
jgi:glycosyltransferase involved in cell wall biosynthesis